MVRRGVGDGIAMKISGRRTRAVFDRCNIGDEKDLERAAVLIESRGQVATTPNTDTRTDTSCYAHY